MRNVIVLITANEEPVVCGNFKKLCLENNLPYNYLKSFKFPILYKDVKIYKKEIK